MADFDKIGINGTYYNVKDSAAQQQISKETKAREAADTALGQQISDISEKLTGAILTNENTFINAAAAGMPSTGDVSAFLNQLMTENPGACIFIPAGTYQAANTINVTAPVFVCLGSIKSTAAVALDIAANDCRVYVYRVNGQSTTDAVKLSGVENGRGRCTVNVDYISGCGVGFHLYDNTNGGGVLRNKFAWNYMDNMGVGILLECGASTAFVNQNYFKGGGIEATCAIKFEGSPADPFNGNIFENVSFEKSTQAINIQKAERNIFRDIRMYENNAQNTIVVSGNCINNYFYGASATVWNGNMINDMGVNFYYNMPIQNTDGITFSNSFRSGGETLFTTPDQYVGNNKLPAGNPDTLSNFYAIDINNNDVVMPAWFSLDYVCHPVFLNVVSVNPENKILKFNGDVISNAIDTTGSSGVKLEAGWFILISPVWMTKI